MHTKEPWEIFHYATRSLTGVCVPYPGGDGATIADFVNREYAERAVACVNACVGIKDPAALRELVEAAKTLLAGIERGDKKARDSFNPGEAAWTMDDDEVKALAAAIAKVQG